MRKLKIFLSIFLIGISIFVAWHFINRTKKSLGQNKAVSQEGIVGQSVNNVLPATDGAAENNNLANLTDSAAQKLIENAFSGIEEAEGSFNLLNPDKLAGEAIQEQIKNFDENIFSVNVDQKILKILRGATKENEKAYFKDFIAAVIKHNKAIQLDLGASSVDEFLSGIRDKILPYITNTTSELYQINVPEKFSNFHIKTIENFEKARLVYAAIGNHKSDSLLALFAIKRVPAINLGFNLLIAEFLNNLKTY